jgi:hypothetical protein
MSASDIPVVVAALVACFAGYCLADLYRARITLHLSRVAWAAVICLTSPIGGMAYLTFGKPH